MTRDPKDARLDALAQALVRAMQSAERERNAGDDQGPHVDLARLALTDPLTGVYNRIYLEAVLRHEHGRAVRLGRPFSLLLADIDQFKAYNDTYGHPAGDEALRTFASILLGTVRKYDHVARWGGEEFAVLLPDTALSEAVSAAERLRRHVEQYAWPLRPITASFGAAQWTEGMTPESLVKTADEALYRAKARRNAVWPVPAWRLLG